MLNFEKIQHILSQISYKDWKFHLDQSGSIIWMQIRFMAPDNSNPGRLELQHGRKWVLSPHMTKSEVVQTALLAVLTAEEHEAREQFTFRGEETFNPHFDIDRLHQLASDEAVDIRAPMISREVLDRMLSGENKVAIMGGRTIGKTFLANEIANSNNVVVPSDNGKAYQKKPRITNNVPPQNDHHA